MKDTLKHQIISLDKREESYVKSISFNKIQNLLFLLFVPAAPTLSFEGDTKPFCMPFYKVMYVSHFNFVGLIWANFARLFFPVLTESFARDI